MYRILISESIVHLINNYLYNFFDAFFIASILDRLQSNVPLLSFILTPRFYRGVNVRIITCCLTYKLLICYFGTITLFLCILPRDNDANIPSSDKILKSINAVLILARNSPLLAALITLLPR